MSGIYWFEILWHRMNRKTTAYHLISDFRNLCHKPILYEKFEKRQADWV